MPWAKVYEVEGMEGVAKGVALAENGDVIVAGYVSKEMNDNFEVTAFVARLDREGNVRWFKTYGGSEDDVFNDVKVAKNGDIIVAGETKSFGAGEKDVWVLRLDSQGNVKWQKTYGGSSYEEANALAIAPNGDIIVAGYTYSFGAGNGDVWVLRLDSEGNVKWEKTYGGSDYDGANALAIAPNGDIIVAGYTYSFGAGKGDVWVLRLDSNGNVKWQKTYGGEYWDWAYALALAPNGDIIVAGYTESFGAGSYDFWVLRLDSQGNVKWEKTYGGSSYDEAYALALAPNGDIIVAGYTKSFGAGSYDFWVLRLDESGNVKWQKTYGGSSSDEAYALALAPNGDIIVAGYTKSFGAGVFLLRLPPDGELGKIGRDSEALVMDTNCEVHNTSCEVLSGVRKGLIFRKRIEPKVMPSKAQIGTVKAKVKTLFYFDREKFEKLLTSLSIEIPGLAEGVESLIRFSLTNDFAEKLKVALNFPKVDFLELETDSLELPLLGRGKRASKALSVKPRYAGSFDFRVLIRADVDGVKIEREKVIPVEIAERGATPAIPTTPPTPATPIPQPVTPTPTPQPITPTSSSTGLQLPADFPSQLAYRYTDVELIGKGGFARVYRAKRKDGKIVAVKIPLSLDENTGRAFLREITNWLHLKHPNIVRLYDANILPIPFLEMEYCESSLAKLRKPLPVEVAAYLVFNIAEGLKYAHSKGIIHRDLKPSNILLKGFTPKISDWGLSKAMAETHSTTLASFTPFYASPEQTSRRFGKPDHRSDIWQLGVIFYELVTGKLPFEGDDLIEVVSRIATDEPVKPSEINPEAKDVEHIILTCLEKDMEERYQSVVELQFELATYLGMRYKKELRNSISADNTRRAAFYAGKLMLMFLKMGNLREAYKYASDLKFYARGNLTGEVEALAEQIKLRLEERLGAPEELLEKAEIIAHKVSLDFERL